MKRISFITGIVISLNVGVINSQNVGINPTGAIPNNSAGLDVDFPNKGLLIPRVALTARNSNAPIGAGIANSLLVYNTATAGTFPNNVYPGYYYWDGTQWQRLMSGAADGWQVTGNTLTGTLPNTPNEFIGTLNNADWIIKTNNTERMRILGNGQVVINNTTPFAGDVFSTFAAGTNAAINGYSNGSGEAVYGQNTGTGLTIAGITTNTNPAVYGQGPSSGVFGIATGANGTGVTGIGTSTNTADGVYGQAGENTSFGVWAVHVNTTTPNGTGLAASGNGVGTSYLAAGSGIAANGSTFAIVGLGKDPSSGNGIAAAGNSLTVISFAGGSGGTFRGQTIGVYGIANSSANNTWGAYFSNANNGAGASYAYVGGITPGGTMRKIDGNGSVGTIVKDLQGNPVTLTCPEAPEILFEDYGVGQLINGRTHIELDPIFAKNVTINEKHPLRVFVQLEGDCNGVYVTNKTSTGFDVVELNGGKSNVKFVYHVVANRADDVDENGNILSKNADVRFGPGMPPKKPIYHETKTKPIPKIPDVHFEPKKVSSK